MLFNSFSFLIFFPIVVLLYFIVPKKVRYIWLLIASYYFYMSWNPKYIVLILISTIITWVSGLLLEKFESVACRKWVVATSFATNLGILFFFKYFDFAINNVNKVLGRVGVELIENPFDILLPVGISFYTFQALSYTVDVYRGQVKAQKNPLRYALFVSFFPQLVAGPIERSKNLLTQIEDIDTKSKWDFDRAVSGLILMCWGLFQKMVIADRLKLFADRVFANIHAFGTIELILAAVAFALQIYCDFSGYSTIALGAAKVMGFDLMENFKVPYFATGIQDFWRRWHISLSSFFRDYVYIPLGGNRKGKFNTYKNLFIVWLLTGLWHGASWNFVLWGLFFFVFLVIEKIGLLKLLEKIPAFFSHAYLLIVVFFGWILFRFSDFRYIPVVIKGLFGLNGNAFMDFETKTLLIGNIIFILVALFSVTPIVKRFSIACQNSEKGSFPSVLYKILSVVLPLGILFLSTLALVGDSYNPFLYFQF